MKLSDKILNIPCEPDKAKKAINRIEYKQGHHDARVKAAKLATNYDELLKIVIAINSNIDLPEFYTDWINDVVERCKND
ncbi:MAG: hypothetical protein ACXVH2_00815 [Methanobacterium sp.]